MEQWTVISIAEDWKRTSICKTSLTMDWIFQHDNDPRHTAVKTKKWLRAKERDLNWLFVA